MRNRYFKFFYILSFVLFLFIPISINAHPGRTDSSGCHTCRTNCSKWGLSTGEYHCHQAKALPQLKAPITSTFSETGGYTKSAPEYAQPKVDVPLSNNNLPTNLNSTPKVESIVDTKVVTTNPSSSSSDNSSSIGWLYLTGALIIGGYWFFKKS